MAKTASTKTSRTGKTGHLGARKSPVSPIDLILLGKGRFCQQPVLSGPSFSVGDGEFGSLDLKQAILNKQAGIC